ncbi:hypothetical protein BT96DRAFT_947693 [Gymnopus androsaceus JB14]|uniref:Uncharacterized protein n=1 Tax=Gymnopus androsaceus JB14 TaxID=1447944 RepID=A0A6A4GT71_9AGAR|nr:hypothetical protein BT96DRAFT_947693 [Gymnopus androsaceus JB14]
MLQNFLKKNSKNNSFTAYFENESTSFRGVVLTKAQKQATYTKWILKETWVSMTLDIFTAVGTQMSSGSRLHTTLGTPMGFCLDSPIGMNSPISWFKHSNSFIIPASQSQTRFKPQETNGTSQDSSNQWTGQVQTRAPAGLQALLQNGFQGPN